MVMSFIWTEHWLIIRQKVDKEILFLIYVNGHDIKNDQECPEIVQRTHVTQQLLIMVPKIRNISLKGA